MSGFFYVLNFEIVVFYKHKTKVLKIGVKLKIRSLVTLITRLMEKKNRKPIPI
ncbi:MAG: hypothetical protein ACI9U0_000806 [Flavobacteriales bacterium]